MAVLGSTGYQDRPSLGLHSGAGTAPNARFEIVTAVHEARFYEPLPDKKVHSTFPLSNGS